MNNTLLATPYLELFDPVSLEDMNSVSLMKRTDTKFLVNKQQLPAILEEASQQYRILSIDNERLMSYKTQYYDTPNMAFYHRHHNKRSTRTKVRIRQYIESNLLFLEVKLKNNKGKTNKSRIQLDNWTDTLGTKELQFIADTSGHHYDLSPTIVNEFNRFTLVDHHMRERATIDLNLRFNNEEFDEDLVIVELKQERLSRQSPMFQILKKNRVYPKSMSKYCIGVAAHFPNLKQNNFKPRFRAIEKLKEQ
jgi:hypothetical protein